MRIRCSSIHKIIGEPKSKAEKEANGLTQTAKSYVIDRLKNEYSGFESFTGSKETEKGLLLEDEAIRCSGLIRGLMYKKTPNGASIIGLQANVIFTIRSVKQSLTQNAHGTSAHIHSSKKKPKPKQKRQAMAGKCKATCGFLIVKRLILIFGFSQRPKSF